MRPLISKLSGYTVMVLFPVIFFWKKPGVFIALVMLLAIAGCFRKFYNSGTTESITVAQIDSLRSADKYFVIHFADGSISEFEDLKVEGDSISGDLDRLDASHLAALNIEKNSAKVLPKAHSMNILREVHLYSTYKVAATTGRVSVPKTSLYRMDVYRFDKNRTTTSTVLSIIGIAVVLSLVILTVVAASTPVPEPTPSGDCNCPKIHIEKEGKFEYVNGVFSGAVYSNLERSDILPLGSLMPDSNIRIRIANTPGEKQFINTVSLIAVKHGASEEILADRKGEFFKLDQFETAITATDHEGNDISQLVNSHDDKPFNFDRDLDVSGASGAILEFNRPKHSGKATLKVRARNTDWAVSLTQSYLSLFGNKYAQWRDHVEKTNPSTMEKRELEQNLPIAVYVQNGEKWEFVDYFPLTGSTAYRDLVMTIPLRESNDPKLKIKLETVFNFWHLDQAVLDPETSSPGKDDIINIPVPGHTKDIQDRLGQKDRNYVVIGDDQSIDLDFGRDGIPASKGSTSYFLKASGYYHYETQFPGEPDMARLKEFRSPGGFSRFSKQQYKEYLYWASAWRK
jgi:hypothetical protein